MKANAHVRLTFDLALTVPDELAKLSPAALSAALSEALGPMVLQGLPTIGGKQLARAGIQVAAHRHRLEASALAVPRADRDELTHAAPHLTEAELDRVLTTLTETLPTEREARLKLLRRKGLAMVNEFRLVPCVVAVTTITGATERVAATLNLTNGSVMVEPEHRHHRTPAGQSALLEVPAVGVTVAAHCAGHTISGPVIEITLREIASHRAPLLQVWQQQQ